MGAFHIDAPSEKRAGQMPCGAHTGRTIGKAAPLGAHPASEIREAARWIMLRGDHDNIGQIPGDTDRHQIPRRVIGQPGIEEVVDHQMPDGSDAHGVAIRRGLRGGINADIAACARAIFDDEILPQDRLHQFTINAHQHIGGPAGGPWHNHAYRACRPSALGAGDGRCREQGGSQ